MRKIKNAYKKIKRMFTSADYSDLAYIEQIEGLYWRVM